MNPLVVSYGGGINSTAVLVGYVERGIRPDAIVFSDTGGEKPETYRTVSDVSAWCIAKGLPAITIVRRLPTAIAAYETLEAECVEGARLPSRAYGFSKCASKWKVNPQIAWMKVWQPAVDTWATGGSVRKAIGFHFDEQRRVKPDIDSGTVKVYPLIEWRWGQQECRDAIARAGLPMPAKSACFFCPSSSAREVANLARNSPDLFRRALSIERGAIDAGKLQTVVGLGRHWTWESVGNAAVNQCQLDFADNGDDLPCGCHDGDDD